MFHMEQLGASSADHTATRREIVGLDVYDEAADDTVGGKRMARKVGHVQLALLECLASRGLWYSGCWWHWDTTSGTRTLLESLVRRGLVERVKESVAPIGDVDVYRVSAAGRVAVDRSGS